MKKSDDLKLEYWAIKRPKPHPKNARSHPPEQVRQLVASIKEFGFTKPIVCDEKNEILAGHGKEGSLHPTMKPVELARRAITNSTREGEIVLDMFSGAGSTIMGAEQMGRVGFAVELDPKYVDATVRRWETLTGKEAIHAKDKKTFAAIAKSRAGRKAKG